MALSIGMRQYQTRFVINLKVAVLTDNPCVYNMITFHTVTPRPYDKDVNSQGHRI